MAWLEGWGKRIKIALDHNDIDTALTNFPHLIYISASSGPSNQDVSCVFDELQSNANRKRIAVTRIDGVSGCYVEIEHWDHANEKAWLWVKIPDVDPDVDTELYLYYDRTHPDNDVWVGDPSDPVVHNVWDANFKFVTHMRDDPDDSHIRDSTVNVNHGTKLAAGEPAVTVGGTIDDAQEFDGTNDNINCGSGNDASFDITEEISISTWLNPEAVQEDDAQPFTRSSHKWKIRLSGGRVYCGYSVGGVDNRYGTTFVYTADEEIHVAFTYSSVTRQVITYKNGVPQAPVTLAGLPYYTLTPTTGNLYLGCASPASRRYHGIEDEVHISNTIRTPAWIKASHESQIDHLNDFGIEELVPPPPPRVSPVLPPRPPPRITYIAERLITFGLIRSPFTYEGSLTGLIRRTFMDEIIFSVAAVKHIDEVVSVGGFIVPDGIPDHAWEALFEVLEKEEEESIE